MTPRGVGYTGTVSVTEDGETCTSWRAVVDSGNSYVIGLLNNFPDASVDDAQNYCRNIDNVVEGPWCYYGNPIDKTYGFCGLQDCPVTRGKLSL